MGIPFDEPQSKGEREHRCNASANSVLIVAPISTPPLTTSPPPYCHLQRVPPIKSKTPHFKMQSAQANRAGSGSRRKYRLSNLGRKAQDILACLGA